MIDLVGWAATSVFIASYFFRQPSQLRRMQMFGALLWATYGLLLGALPVIVANVLLIMAAAWTARRRTEGDPANVAQAAADGSKAAPAPPMPG
jgi:hypothetical protein